MQTHVLVCRTRCASFIYFLHFILLDVLRCQPLPLTLPGEIAVFFPIPEPFLLLPGVQQEPEGPAGDGTQQDGGEPGLVSRGIHLGWLALYHG